MWVDTRVKIRRFLRDPSANIWEDDLLLNLWNDAQREYSQSYNFGENVVVLRHPAQFQISFLYPWEWSKNEHDQGHTYRALILHHQWGVVSYNWEAQAVGINSASETDEGTQYTHPWEAYCGITPAQMPPQWFPYDFESAVFMAYDLDPLEFIPFKQLMSQDRRFETYQGAPQNWTTRDDVSQEWYLYPDHGAVWSDTDGEGVVVSASWPEVADALLVGADGNYIYGADENFIEIANADESGTPIDITGAETTDNYGVTTDLLRADGNVLLIYKHSLEDIANPGDEPGLPRYLQKYLEYDVLSKAYRAQTDGQIKSLSEYWQWRAEIGKEVLNRFRWKRLEDRNYQLTSGGAVSRKHRGPRLPAEYPPV